jgi:hypothetical protein
MIVILGIFLSVVPGHFMYKYLLKIIRPRESIIRLLLFVLAIFITAFLYTIIGTYIWLKFIFPPNK